MVLEVARRYQAKVPGGKWQLVANALQEVYGKNRQTFIGRSHLCRDRRRLPPECRSQLRRGMLGATVCGRRPRIGVIVDRGPGPILGFRMLTAAQTLPDTVLLSLERSGIPNSCRRLLRSGEVCQLGVATRLCTSEPTGSAFCANLFGIFPWLTQSLTSSPRYIFDNRYFTGLGPDLGRRLSDAGRLAVIDIYDEEMQKGYDWTACSARALRAAESSVVLWVSNNGFHVAGLGPHSWSYRQRHVEGALFRRVLRPDEIRGALGAPEAQRLRGLGGIPRIQACGG